MVGTIWDHELDVPVVGVLVLETRPPRVLVQGFVPTKYVFRFLPRAWYNLDPGVHSLFVAAKCGNGLVQSVDCRRRLRSEKEYGVRVTGFN